MTTWSPTLEDRQGPGYARLLEALTEDISRGTLQPGERLPTQRDLSRTLGVALGTVTRAYTEGVRSGFLEARVGRGTFVARKSESEPDGPWTSFLRSGGLLDLALNHPLHCLDPDLRAALRGLARRPATEDCLRYQPQGGSERHRRAGATWSRFFGHADEPGTTHLCSGAQHAVFVALASFAQPGDGIACDRLTYPGFLASSRILRLKPEPIPGDAEGILPAALDAACRRRRLRGLYCMPNLNNPTAASLSAERREAIVDIARRHGLLLLEDDTAPPHGESPPPALSSLAPERGFFISSMSKLVAGGLRIGFLTAPREWTEKIVHALWATHWSVPQVMAEIATTWIEDGTALRVAERKLAEAEARQAIACELLSFHDVRSAPASFFVWVPLPAGKSAGIVLEARRRGVAVTGGHPFSADGSGDPDGIRICIGGPESQDRLREGLEILASVLSGQHRGGVPAEAPVL